MRRVTLLAIGGSAYLLASFPPAGLLAMPGLGPPQKHKAIERLAAEYVSGYQQELTAIVADERYTQQVKGELQEPGVRFRSTSGEVFFIFTAARGWMAIRDVLTVDGVPAPERTHVREILRTLPAMEVGARMRSYNARFNIGPVVRDINEPTLALLSLDAGHRARFRFSAKDREVRGGRELVRLRFQERDRPTLIRGIGGGTPVFMKGELLVEASNGRIWESRLTATVDRIDVELTTEYSLDERLGLMVPAVFRERYLRERERDEREKEVADFEEIHCEASYSNFRRFEVSARLR